MAALYRVRIRRGDVEVEVESTDKKYVKAMLAEHLSPPAQQQAAPSASPGAAVPGGKQTSLQEFVKQVAPKAAREYVVTVIYFKEKSESMAEVRPKDVAAAFKSLKYKCGNVSDAVAKAKRGGHLMSGDSPRCYVVTNTGENWVQERLAEQQNAGQD